MCTFRNTKIKERPAALLCRRHTDAKKKRRKIKRPNQNIYAIVYIEQHFYDLRDNDYARALFRWAFILEIIKSLSEPLLITTMTQFFHLFISKSAIYNFKPIARLKKKTPTTRDEEENECENKNNISSNCGEVSFLWRARMIKITEITNNNKKTKQKPKLITTISVNEILGWNMPFAKLLLSTPFTTAREKSVEWIEAAFVNLLINWISVGRV